jgi:hypothetical protein
MNATGILFVDISHEVYRLGSFCCTNKIAPQTFAEMLLQSLAAFLAYNCNRMIARDMLLTATNKAVELINRSPERQIFDAAYDKALNHMLKQHSNEAEKMLHAIEQFIKNLNETEA